MSAFPPEAGVQAVLLTGNPRIWSVRGLDVRAGTIGAWVEKSASSGLLGGLGAGAGRGSEKGAPAGKAPGSAPPPPSTSAAGAAAGAPAGESSIAPESLLAFYAEGAVDLQLPGLSFRASEAYVDLRSNQALLVEPRYDTHLAVPNVKEPVPLYVRAERARIVSRGLAAFDSAHVATTRASDAFTLDVTRLTVEEFDELKATDSTFLGFKQPGGKNYYPTQHFVAEDIHARGERLPLFWWPRAEFGGENAVSPFPVQLKSLTAGKRSSLGYWGILGLGGDVSRTDDRSLEWTALAGGYSKRGPAAGLNLDAKVRDPADRSRVLFQGSLETFGVWDTGGPDRSLYQAPREERGHSELEARWEARDDLRLDVEANLFTDRGFQKEYFESDFRNHKDRETYARLRWMRGGTAVTATEGFHVRDFATETVDEPTVGLWSESLPLLPASSPVGVDLSTAASAGRLARRVDEALPDPAYEAWRVDVTERLYAPFDVGDVRVSPFVGLRGTGYYDRTDGGPDVTRAALEAGVRANLQLHRDFGCYGGPWALDGLRNVIDLDAGYYARAFDAHGRNDVPFFDRVEPEEDRTEVTLEARTRLETRRVLDGRRGNAALLDARALLSLWPEGIGPAGKRGDGEVLTRVWAEVLPGAVWMRAESATSLWDPTIEHATGSVMWSPTDDLGVAVGLRHVHHETLAPWVDAWWRWNEKWGLHVSAIRDVTHDRYDSFQVKLLRLSEDHVIDVGISVRNGGKDVSFVFDVVPAIGGVPVSPPFSPPDQVDLRP